MLTTSNSASENSGASNYGLRVDEAARNGINTDDETGVHTQTDNYYPPVDGPWPQQGYSGPDFPGTTDRNTQHPIGPTTYEDNYRRHHRPPLQRQTREASPTGVTVFLRDQRGQPPVVSEPRQAPLPSYHVPSGDYSGQQVPPPATHPPLYGGAPYTQLDYRGQPGNYNYVPPLQQPVHLGTPYAQYTNLPYYPGNYSKHGPQPPPQAPPSMFYVPRKRGTYHYGWCEGCNDYNCSSQITIKDYDSAA
ncbi:hypothetical protein Pmar_PMAR014503 [Perkinsus marinus ATCC 50983]|uniref:Uncharacterized protein n=1 Tax=Perkinsus marinus (strain ATCC 50983 / TXsc) TaxID=423536 RepID=C5KW94_PERM5|nr:hypothetical protein Pmar_PMAR014503 [Perkinsus marinus ATCC 50983]EER11205.1 hypothetical protein Pmar_PMAR014503 [Perkinsus marinus ATCC 50983]|eukprot:XP_002779410.1 hypothetical protein Pmar_PMAR014503 [Perkinsus marinus ATCC 50983]